MAGPWYVDPDAGLTTNNGLSPATPWKLIPGQTGATAQTGYGVVAGDTINVRNGTRSTLQLLLPANNLTYRGYGVAANKLVLKLPMPFCPRVLYDHPVAREPGVHEGMWTIDSDGAATNPMVSYSVRSGCVIEDMEVLAPLSGQALAAGSSTSTAIVLTLRRSSVNGSAGGGMSNYARQVTVEDCLFKDIGDDALIFGASASNGNRAGYADVVRRCNFINPGYNETSGIGDAIQTFANVNVLESSLLIEDIYVYKPSHTKQSVVFTDVKGGLTVRRFHLAGTPDSHAQILISGLGGTGSATGAPIRHTITDGYIRDGCQSNAAIRYAGTQGIETGALLEISNIIVDALLNAGLFNLGASDAGDLSTVDGTVIVRNCYIGGANTAALSFSGGVSFHPGAATTIGANALLQADNNVILCSGQPAVRLPVGGANDARFKARGNITGGLTYAIGSTEYANAAAFQAVHNGALSNQSVDPQLSASFLPLLGSPALNGYDTGYKRDQAGRQCRKHVGAFGTARMRRQLGAT